MERKIKANDTELDDVHKMEEELTKNEPTGLKNMLKISKLINNSSEA